MDDFVGCVFAGVCLALVAALLWAVPAVVVNARVEAQCLRQGYPRAEVAWDYTTYCVGLDGAARTVVVPVKP